MTFNALIPELSVTDIDRTRQFYTDILGFHVEYERQEDKFLFLSFGKAQLMLEQINHCWETGNLEYPLGRGINFQIDITGIIAIEKLTDSIKQKNIPLYRDLSVAEYKANEARLVIKEILLQDPDGYLLRFSETVAVK